MRKLKLWLMIVVAMILIGCGTGDNKGSKSIFSDSNNSPIVDSVVDINSTVELSDTNSSEINHAVNPSETNTSVEHEPNKRPLYYVEQNKTDIVAYIRENTQEAFKVNGKDRTNIYYSLSGKDSKLCDIDPITGEIFFRKATDYETKSLYIFNVVSEDTVGHKTLKKVTIHIIDTIDEEHITIEGSGLYSVEQNETDILLYIRENTREAFKVSDRDSRNILYLLSGKDSKLCDIDPLDGYIYFREPTDYERKSLYEFNVILQDSVGHRTVKRVTIHIVDIKNEEDITIEGSGLHSVEQNETDIVVYIRENTREAFKIHGKERTRILYSLSGNDFELCYIDPINGEIFFKKPTDYETKSLYQFNVVLQIQ